MNAHSSHRFTRQILGLTLILLGVARAFVVQGPSEARAISIFDSVGLVILGSVFMLIPTLKMTRTLSLITLAIVGASVMDIGIISPRLLFVVAMIMAIWIVWPRRFVRRKEKIVVEDQHKRTIAPHSEYQSFLSCRAYLERNAKQSKRITIIGHEECIGARWKFGPICFDHFVGDVEPAIEPGGPRRLVIWQPLREAPVPTGWKTNKLFWLQRLKGFVELPTDDSYPTAWSEHARRHLKKWRAQTEWEVTRVPLKEFLVAYKRSPQNPILKGFFLTSLTHRNESQPGMVICYAAKRVGSDKIESGLAVFNIPEANQSEHVISFINREGKDAPIGIGLMDQWFKDSIAAGLRYLDMGVFWAPGDPDSWHGFSRFKSQFNITYIFFPRPRIRWVGFKKCAKVEQK